MTSTAGHRGPELSAYVLAGGRSSRMGTDKALIELAGKPLIAHTLTKLRRLTPRVHILSANAALAPYAPLVPDLHPDTGPIGGIEAALTHSSTDWNLIYPVDVPFVPTVLLEWWLRAVNERRSREVRVALFRVDGVPQPTLLLIHRAVGPILSRAISRGAYKLFPVLEEAARELAPATASDLEPAPFILPVDEHLGLDAGQRQHSARLEPWRMLTEAQRDAQAMWFANVNTPDDLAEAERHLSALDT